MLPRFLSIKPPKLEVRGELGCSGIPGISSKLAEPIRLAPGEP